MKKIYIHTLLTTLVMLSALFVPGMLGVAEAGGKQAACDGVELTGGSCNGAADVQVGSLLEQAINIFSFVVGITAVIMIIIGGFRYVTSGGDANSTKGAKDTIIYAVVGLVIVALAQIIVRFVLAQV